MRTIVLVLIDAYITVLLLHWLLHSTPLKVSSGIKASLARAIRPYHDWVRRSIAPQYNGHDLTPIAAIVLLLAIRTLIQGVIIF